ncbi:MAG TPA: TatD family hydrolase [Lachnospiraceae bacterium]|nr:TatD family hydrolase [Lachnospiraceae bacterium]
MIFESHAHYDDEAFDQDRNELLAQIPENGIAYVVNISASLETCRKVLKLIEQYPYLYGTLGVHPNDVLELNEEGMEWLEKKSASEKIVAIGEIGLDYHYDEPSKEIQKKWFIRQLDLARKVQLPIIIHSREAAQDTLDIMKAEKAGDIGGVVHCFSYGIEMAREYLSMGFYIGVGGVITFKNAKKLREVVEYAPLDRILLETDCPYLAPEPYRGKRNSSLNLPYVVEEIARIKNISREEVEAVTLENAKKMYRIQ